jgi:hypothetical protein
LRYRVGSYLIAMKAVIPDGSVIAIDEGDLILELKDAMVTSRSPGTFVSGGVIMHNPKAISIRLPFGQVVMGTVIFNKLIF